MTKQSKNVQCSIVSCHFAEKQKPRRAFRLLGVFIPGDDLVSHTVARAVPSALRGLTSVFGMGTGVALSVGSPENRFNFQFSFAQFSLIIEN